MHKRLSALLLAIGVAATAVSAAELNLDVLQKMQQPRENFRVCSDTGYPVGTALRSVDDLAKQLNERADLVVVDFRNAKLPGGYIPGAIKIAHDDVMENRDGRKRMLVSQQQLEQVLSAAGIDADDRVLIYDDNNSLWATRLWWTLKSYGHKQVQVLNGGLAAWQAAGHDTELSAASRPATRYQAKGLDANYIADYNEVVGAEHSAEDVLLDARGTSDTEKGMISGAHNIEWSETQNADGTFKSTEELQKLFASRGLSPDQRVINYCNSGIKASINTFVLRELLGFTRVENYDGSMIDYRLSQKQVAAQ